MAKNIYYKSEKTGVRPMSTLAFVLNEKKRRAVPHYLKTVNPVLKKWGDNYIEIQPMSSVAPYIYDIPEGFEFHKAGSRLQRFAKFLVKIRIAGIQRLGRDILEEY